MRHILTSVVLVIFLFPAIALGGEVTMDDLVYLDDLHYKKFTDIPFTGVVSEKSLRGSFRNGKKDGSWVHYHDNGRLYYKGTYKDGEQDGPWVWYYDNGQLWNKGVYKGGEMDGPWFYYWSNGEFSEGLSGTFKDGEKVD